MQNIGFQVGIHDVIGKHDTKKKKHQNAPTYTTTCVTAMKSALRKT